MTIKDNIQTPPAADLARETGPWDKDLAQLRDWDPEWARTCVKMSTNPWTSGILPLKTIELIGVAMNAACTNLNPEGTRRHIRAALEPVMTQDQLRQIWASISPVSFIPAAIRFGSPHV